MAIFIAASIHKKYIRPAVWSRELNRINEKSKNLTVRIRVLGYDLVENMPEIRVRAWLSICRLIVGVNWL